jgi:O-antigen/teichoic acid export membrane protein
VRNLLWLSAVQAANLLAPVVVLPLLLRRLGVVHFGQYIVGQTIVGLCVIVVDWGFNITATQSLAATRDSPSEVTRLFSEVVGAKCLLAMVVASTLGVALLISSPLTPLRPIILAYMPWILGSVLFPQWLFQGLERMGLLLACVVAGRALVIPLTFALVHDASDTWIAALLNAGATVIMGLTALMLIATRGIAGWKTPSLRRVYATLSAGSHVFVGTLATSLYATVNTLLLAGLSPPVQVGLFAVGDKIKTLFQAPITPWSAAVIPRVARTMAADPAEGVRLALRVLALTVAGTLCLSLALTLGAPVLVRIVAGPAYAGAIPVLRTLGCLPLVVGVNTVLGLQLMLPLGMKRLFSLTLIGGGLLNCGLLATLAPRHGAEGAAVAVVVTEIAVTLVMAACVSRKCLSVLSAGKPALGV